MSHPRAAVLIAILLVLFFITTIQAADPAWYAKQGTWQDTVKTSLDNKAKGIAAANARAQLKVTKGFQPFVTKVVKGGQAPLEISVPIKGLKDMILMVTEADGGNNCDHSAWANAKLIDAQGNVTWLDTIKPKTFKIGWGRLEIEANDTRRPVVIGGKTFPRYIFAHAFSAIHYDIGGQYERFEATVGMDQRMHRSAGSVNFVVTNDRKSIPRGSRSQASAMSHPIWEPLLRDFPASQQNIMVVHDWLRQDKLDIEDASNRFKAPAAAALKAATETLTYVTQSTPQAELAAELAGLTRKHKAAKDSQWRALYMETKQLRRRIIFSHPALDFEKILINVNPPTLYSHNGDQHLGRHSRVGNGLTILTDWKTQHLQATPMLKPGLLPEGAVRNPDLHYDAEKVVFAFCDHTREGQKRYFLYEAALDGSWVRQLTGTARDKFNTWNNRATVIIEDNDPCYLPDGSLIFITTRCQSYGRCHGGRYNPAWTLHRCDPNGDNIQQLSFGNENEYEPSVLNDGRIVFTRWEYTNRHEMFFHMLWACRPDGTNVGHFFGNDMLHPMMMVEATAIPGTHRVATTAQGHHSYNTGTTVVLDPHIGENTEDAITHMTPETPYSETQGWPEPHYSHPYPVTDDLFLASRANHRVRPQGSTPPPADRGIYLVDPVGGRELIYENPDIASFSPIAIRKRKRPPVLASALQPDAPQYGTVFLQNAYLTRNDPDGIIKPGMIKAIRVIALGVQPRANRTACSLQVGVEIPKKVIGTLPVDEHGAAYFKA
ncbi:MAG: NPCBM/NEW2 domain-containing protein, partial [Phycisphaeraceae bacterium]|nr:NPCBM/NEW2 domain-containing protein [Phycisphaeraceae bacterium]